MKYLQRFPFPFSRKDTRIIAAYAEKRNYTNCRLFVAHETFYFSFYGDEALFFFNYAKNKLQGFMDVCWTYKLYSPVNA